MTIRNFILATTALVAFSAPAFAADLPSRHAPPVFVSPVPVFSWTGFYAGGQVGYEFGSSNYNIVEENVDAPRIEAPDLELPSFSSFARGSGVAGGGHAGYNYEIPGFGIGTGLVVGIEGDVNGSDYQSDDPDLDVNVKMKSAIKGSVRGRVGVAFDRALFYATGGAAFAQFKFSDEFDDIGGSVTHDRVGYTLGGGIDYAITPNWSLQIEYRYSDYGTFTLAGEGSGRDHEKDNLVQVGFSYLFTSPIVPVVAKY